MLSKRNIRLLGLTGMLLFVLFFITRNAQSATRSYLDPNSPTAASALSNSEKVDSEINSIKQDISNTKGNSVSADTKDAVKSGNGNNNGNGKGVAKTSEDGLDDEDDYDNKYNPEAEYKEILQKSPIVVFSKTYCPYSKRLKSILKEYTFDPEFVVVELDKHENGAELQKFIGGKTGRSTVPNVIINGISRGGCDDFAGLHDQNTLLDSLKQWGGSTLTVDKPKKGGNSGVH